MTIDGFGEGLYTPSEAARLAGLRTDRVRRWLKGYDYTTKDGHRSASPLVTGYDAQRAVSFLDLIEVLFVRAFLKHGVSMHTIRLAAEAARDEFKTDHPFCIHRFETDGRTIFARVKDEVDDEKLVDMARRQVVFSHVFHPLLKQLEFDADSQRVARWWPLGKGKHVVIDPGVSFGEPVISTKGIPTRILSAPVLAGRTHKAVADWYEVPVREVHAAVAFERSLSSAA
jgi:uncharacterized protein (DUF433 family)